jgi:putative sigma-54 modulation protein
MVLDKLETQIKKNKEKIKNRRTGSKDRTKGPMPDEIEDDDPMAEEEVVQEIRVKTIDYKPMHIEEAVLQMDLMKDNFLVFTNAQSDQVNVLYRRKDGHFGLIQPN